jgi:hypothetical protein
MEYDPSGPLYISSYTGIISLVPRSSLDLPAFNVARKKLYVIISDTLHANINAYIILWL